MPHDRDKEIAARALKRGLLSEEVEEIIAESPVDWTRDETRLIASLALEHLEQERERLQQKRSQLEREQQQQQKPERKQSWGLSL